MASKSTRRRVRFQCADCGHDTGKMKEFYFVRTDLWLTVMPTVEGMLCIGCLEARLDRRLVATDFTDASINDPRHGSGKSARLLSRLQAA